MGKKKERGRFQLKDVKAARIQMRRLAPYALRYWPRFLIYLVCTLLYWAGYGGRFLLIKEIGPMLDPQATDMGQAFHFLSQDNIYFIAGLFFLGSIAMALGTFGKQYHMNWIIHRGTLDVQRDLTNNIIRQPVAFFNLKRKGELMSRVTNDLSGVRQTYHILFNDLVSHPIGIIVLSAGAVYTSPTLGLAVLLMPIVLLPVIMLAGKIKRLSRRSLESQAELSNFFHQLFEGIRVVKAFHMEKRQSQELDDTGLNFFKRSVKVGKYKGISRALVEIVLGAMIAAGLVGGVSLLSSNILGEGFTFWTLAQFIAFLMALYDPVRKLSHTLNNMSQSMAANERVFELIDLEPEIKDLPDARRAAVFSDAIRFEKVNFEYQAGYPVLHDISFQANKGTLTAFVGQTGAGKSTLLDLIARFYLPCSGKIIVDGHDLKALQHRSWLEQIAIVSQETFLFNTSVRENLLSVREDADEHDLIECLKAANIYDEIKTLPQGLDTLLGDRGINLSGGQRQRLAIARAFVKQAPILLLDEATSALDTETEQKVQEALERLIKGATVFAIAHRLSTIVHADRILVLEKGRLIEEGNHQSLMKDNGRYAHLYRTQFTSALDEVE